MRITHTVISAESMMVHGEAIFDPTRQYRYWLERRWGAVTRAKTVAFLMLNPSTADAEVFDPTVRRCYGYAVAWGYSRLLVGNLFAYRSTNPKALRSVPDPVGPDNDTYLTSLAREAACVVCAWGNSHRDLLGRARAVERLLGTLQHPCVCSLGALTAWENPPHPLYLRGDLPRQPFLRVRPRRG